MPHAPPNVYEWTGPTGVKFKQLRSSATGIYYHHDTPAKLVALLDRLYQSRQRVHIHHGDRETGRDWIEEFESQGYIGCSMGPIKVPLLIYNSRSHGGGPISDHSIVRVRHGQCDLWRHPLYVTPLAELKRCRIKVPDGRVLTCGVIVNGENHANFETREKAERWIKKMGLHAMHMPPVPHEADCVFAAA